eukprot:1321190-Amorphochlora_amoeboformis.AAC.2
MKSPNQRPFAKRALFVNLCESFLNLGSPARIPTEKIGIVKLIEQEAFGVCEKTIVKLGAGRKPVKGQEVKIHAKGRFMKSKKKFWDTREKKQEGEKIKPYKFRLGIGKVIK